MKRLIVTILGSVFLLVSMLLALSTQAQTVILPGIASVTPNTGPNDRQTPITITGQGFTTATLAYLDDIPLLRVTFVDSATLQARVPFGLETGVYTLTVTDTETATLTNAFTVTQGSGWATGGPYGGTVDFLVINPAITSTLYAFAEQSGVYRTTDGAQHWELVLYDPALRPGPVEVWPIIPTVVFAGGQAGLYRSDQGGDPGSWTLVLTNTTGEPRRSAFAIASSDPYTMYAIVDRSVLHSSDGGVNWQACSTNLPDSWFWLLATDPNDAATVYAVSTEQRLLYKTTNAGQTWTELTYPIPEPKPGTIATDPYRPATVWLGAQKYGLYRSIDGGQTFTQVTALPSSRVKSVRFDPNQDRILVSMSPVYYSDDGGSSWEDLNCWGCADTAVAPGDSNIIYAAKDGVRKTIDGGQNWTQTSEGIAAVSPVGLAVSPYTPRQILMMSAFHGTFGSYNSGNEWVTHVLSPDIGTSVSSSAAFDPVSPTIAYVTNPDVGVVFKTTDDGQSWQPTANLPRTGLTRVYSEYNPLSIAIHPYTHTTLYVGLQLAAPIAPTVTEWINDGALYRSDDSGDSWILISTTVPISNVGRIIFAPGHPEIIYLAFGDPIWRNGGDDILRSLDGGQTWVRPSSQLSQSIAMALAVSPVDTDTLLAAVWNHWNNGRGIYHSTSGGDSWTQSSGLSTWAEQRVYEIAYDPADARLVYAATESGLRYSVDGGQSWRVYPGPMGQIPIKTLAITRHENQTYLYLGIVGGSVTVQPTMLQAAQLNVPQATQSELLFGGGVYMKQAALPVAGFTAFPVNGVRPLNVAFADTSTGIVTDWLWDFGDTFTSTQANPTHTYSTTGVYTVALTVSGPDGTDTLTRTNYITVTEPPCVPKWIQRNSDGFGFKANSQIPSLQVFESQLYAATTNYSRGALIRRSADGITWTVAITFGFGTAYTNTNPLVFDMAEFKGQLYAGAGNWSNDGVGGQIWRSPNGTDWTLVEGNGFGNANNTGIVNFGVLSDTLYACTFNTVNGLDIWRSSTGNSSDWTRVISNGFTSGSHYPLCTGLTVFDSYLYAAVEGATGGSAQVWRTDNGFNWNQVNTSGFGDLNNTGTGGWASFNGYLYLGTWNDVAGAQVWRSSNGLAWTRVISDGFGNLENYKIESLIAFDAYLYAAANNNATGIEVWRSRDGMVWEQANLDGFGDSNNANTLWSNATAAFNNRLYIGTSNNVTGGELWQKAIAADFTASPISGAAPLAVTLTNLSDGDYLTSTWNLGDGVTSTQASLIHTYTKGGVFTVTLTVSDDIDTSTLIRANYIQAIYRVYLPVVLRNP